MVLANDQPIIIRKVLTRLPTLRDTWFIKSSSGNVITTRTRYVPSSTKTTQVTICILKIWIIWYRRPGWSSVRTRYRNRKKFIILLHQKSKITELPQDFGMTDYIPPHTPYELTIKLSAYMCPTTDEYKQTMANYPYHGLIGKLTTLV